MKKLLILPIAILAFGFTYFQKATPYLPIEIGTVMPKSDVKLYDVVSGTEISLNDKKGKNGMLVMFSCNTCPFVIANEARIKSAQAEAVQLNIGMVIINSNEAYRDGDDSKDAMKSYAAAQKYTVPYLADNNDELANAYGATRTPETFLFDKDGKLVYRGAIDDSPRDESAVKTKYLSEAMTALAAGKEIVTKTTVSAGCGIKRK
jgi:thioredoxin-related protein